MDNIYLISGTSFRRVQGEINKIVKGNIYLTYDLNVDDLDDVVAEASYVSLFDEKKYMIVKNAYPFSSEKRVRKDLQEILLKNEDELNDIEKEKFEKFNNKNKILLDYLDNPNPNTIIIFCLYDKIDSKKKICKIIKEKYNYIELSDMKPKDLRVSVEKYLTKDGYKIDYETSNYIINNSLNNYDIAMNEADKIKLYYNKACQVKLNDVKQIVNRNLEDSNFKFIDAVLSKNVKLSFQIYDDLLLQHVEPIMLLSMLAKEIRYALLTKDLLLTNNKMQIMGILNIRYDFQMDKIINNSYNYQKKELEELLIYLCDLDYNIKIGKVSNKMSIVLFILKICS